VFTAGIAMLTNQLEVFKDPVLQLAVTLL